MYPHQGAKRSSLRALSQDLSKHSSKLFNMALNCLEIFFPLFKHYDLIQNICKKSQMTLHLGNSSALS